MEKLERSLLEPVGEVNFRSSKWSWEIDLKKIPVKS